MTDENGVYVNRFVMITRASDRLLSCQPVIYQALLVLTFSNNQGIQVNDVYIKVSDSDSNDDENRWFSSRSLNRQVFSESVRIESGIIYHSSLSARTCAELGSPDTDPQWSVALIDSQVNDDLGNTFSLIPGYTVDENGSIEENLFPSHTISFTLIQGDES